MMTRRGRLRELLKTRDDGFSLKEIQDIMDVRRGALLDDLRHLQLSLKHEEETLLVAPPACIECGFTFHLKEPRAPGRCPSCKSEKIRDPVFKVEADRAAPMARREARA
ncbi:MAG TPA: transcriptional regulator [Candidatus Thermoplasmatota archaeon]|nr:transcriptional regulator [Candidatus Thermoplasmatota archaeon]